MTSETDHPAGTEAEREQARREQRRLAAELDEGARPTPPDRAADPGDAEPLDRRTGRAREARRRLDRD